MKKLISLALALVFVLSMATVAFAATDDNSYSDYVGVKPQISKTYTVNHGTAPAETFTFTFTGYSCLDNEGKTVTNPVYPEIDSVSISFNAITTTTTQFAEVEIDPSDFNLGVYTYEVKESIPADGKKTAGTTYTTDKLYLVITILLDDNEQNYVAAVHLNTVTGEKTNAAIGNSYDAGTLEVSKEITGNMADMRKKFPFTVVLTPATGTQFDSSVQVQGGTASLNTDGTITVTKDLGDGEKLIITNIPAGTAYTVTEVAGEYTSTSVWSTGADQKITGGETESVTFTNDLTKGVDTGITLDTLPFVLILAVCAGAVVLFVVKRRRSTEF